MNPNFPAQLESLAQLVITGAIVLLVMAVATISIVRLKYPENESH